MPVKPGTSPIPPPVFMPQTSGAAAPTPSPIPRSERVVPLKGSSAPKDASAKKEVVEFALPKLRLEIRDLMLPGTKAFLSAVVPSVALEFAVRRSLDLLYVRPDCPTTKVPGVRSITLIIRSMDGVAYTTGSDLDDDHKEIHFSAEYINNVTASRKADEILGVLTHEVVHCYQYNGLDTCPGGLIEGIADFVRLNSGLSPPHWSRSSKGSWDAGYQNTAYFLQYLETRYGDGTVRKINEKLRTDKYQTKRFWTELLGRPVEQLWGDYGKTIDEEAEQAGTSNTDDEIVMVEKEETPGDGKSSEAGAGVEKPTKTALVKEDEPAGEA